MCRHAVPTTPNERSRRTVDSGEHQELADERDAYVNDEVALTQRIRPESTLDLGLFALDGKIKYSLKVSSP